ncbi:hypothetical protein BC826DRAFT_974178, partial [Russula brevipes]
ALTTKAKPDLQDVARALGLPTTGCKKELIERITSHFDANPVLRNAPRYEGLFNRSRRRPVQDENVPIVPSPAGPSSHTAAIVPHPRPYPSESFDSVYCNPHLYGPPPLHPGIPGHSYPVHPSTLPRYPAGVGHNSKAQEQHGQQHGQVLHVPQLQQRPTTNPNP